MNAIYIAVFTVNSPLLREECSELITKDPALMSHVYDDILGPGHEVTDTVTG